MAACWAFRCYCCRSRLQRGWCVASPPAVSSHPASNGWIAGAGVGYTPRQLVWRCRSACSVEERAGWSVSGAPGGRKWVAVATAIALPACSWAWEDAGSNTACDVPIAGQPRAKLSLHTPAVPTNRGATILFREIDCSDPIIGPFVARVSWLMEETWGVFLLLL